MNTTNRKYMNSSERLLWAQAVVARLKMNDSFQLAAVQISNDNFCGIAMLFVDRPATKRFLSYHKNRGGQQSFPIFGKIAL
jgi:hypothetical protein